VENGLGAVAKCSLDDAGQSRAEQDRQCRRPGTGTTKVPGGGGDLLLPLVWQRRQAPPSSPLLLFLAFGVGDGALPFFFFFLSSFLLLSELSSFSLPFSLLLWW
jgi:hypothetical protein